MKITRDKEKLTLTCMSGQDSRMLIFPISQELYLFYRN